MTSDPKSSVQTIIVRVGVTGTERVAYFTVTSTSEPREVSIPTVVNNSR